jgi:hypothetical protein
MKIKSLHERLWQVCREQTAYRNGTDTDNNVEKMKLRE